jgi:N-methylhydantoinase B
VLEQIPAGAYHFVDYFEDDYVSGWPVRIELCLVARGDGTILLDFSGSDPQVRSALNLPTGGMPRHPFLSLGLTHYVVTQAESIHLNAGILRCIDLKLPEASVVNAAFPAACGMRYTTAMRVHDMILGALHQAVPGRVPAGGASTVVVTYISTSELGQAGRVVVANPVPGSSGGGPTLDGVSGTDFSCGFLRNVPVEILESEAPVRVHRFGLRPDSEGPGTFRGGFGVDYDVEIRHPSAVVVMRGKDRHRFSSWGVAGGQAGLPGGNIGMRSGEPPRDIGKQTVYRAELGEVISIRSGGGGGFGDPLDRDPCRVAADVHAGLVSPVRARDVYGVVLERGHVHVEETQRLRAQMRSAREDVADVEFGPARSQWERVYGVAAHLVAQWLPTLPAPIRRRTQERVYRVLACLGAGPYTREQVERVIQEAEAAIRDLGFGRVGRD